MPELPDVETFKRYLRATSLHQRIVDVDVRSAYVLKRVSGRELARRLKGRSFESTRRHGKHLFVCADRDFWLRLHFGMRSEEHTSELQSRLHLVCRLLLEKKKNNSKQNILQQIYML